MIVSLWTYLWHRNLLFPIFVFPIFVYCWFNVLFFPAKVSPQNLRSFLPELKQYSVGQDCPIFTGLYDFSRVCASGSVGGAVRLNSGEADVAINWGGGLHHAKKKEASGFCYVNDCKTKWYIIYIGRAEILELIIFHFFSLHLNMPLIFFCNFLFVFVQHRSLPPARRPLSLLFFFICMLFSFFCCCCSKLLLFYFFFI